ncbi:hypothetical protein V8D89_003677 [Ganoderma adspersum]
MLSWKALPKLSRLTCPHIMVWRFGNWDREKGTFRMPVISFSEPGGFYLEPYHDSLETLEFVSAWGYSISRQSLELPSLKYLYISSGSNVVSHILSWLSLPQTATIHIANFNFYFARDTTKLRSLASTIGRVHLQLLPHHQGCEDYRLERAHHCLVLSVSESATSDPESGDRAVDLRALLYLMHLDGCGLDTKTVTCMLQPDSHVERDPGQAAADALLCPSLAELVIDISCGFVHRSTAASSASGGRAASSSSLCGPDPGTDSDIDELFRQKCSVLQRLLAAHASYCLTSLHLRLHPSTSTALDSEAPGSGSKDSADAGAAETSVTLQELVDGPVDFRLRRPNWWRDVYP